MDRDTLLLDRGAQSPVQRGLEHLCSLMFTYVHKFNVISPGIPGSGFLTMDPTVSTKAGKLVLFLSPVLAGGKKSGFFYELFVI